MQHIVSFSFAIEDDDLRRAVVSAASEEAKKQVKNTAKEVTSRYGRDDLIEAIATQIIEQSSEQIINEVVKSIARRLPGRKAFLEAVSKGVLDKALEAE